MPTTVFHTATTLNGYLADDRDSLGWLFAVEGASEAEEDFGAFLQTVGAFVMGANTYEWVVRLEEAERPGMWAQTYGALPCFVFTRRTLPVPAGADVRFVHGEVADHWPEIAMTAAEDVVWLVGGGDLVGQFDDAGHLDEIRVSIAPALLPAGKPLLPRRIGPERLQLLSAHQAGQFVEARYRVIR